MFRSATRAREQSTSRFARALAVVWILDTSLRRFCPGLHKNRSYSRENSLSSAPRIVSSSSFNRGVIYRSALVKVCLRIQVSGTMDLIGIGYFQVIAKNLIILHLQIFNACFFAFFAFPTEKATAFPSVFAWRYLSISSLKPSLIMPSIL